MSPSEIKKKNFVPVGATQQSFLGEAPPRGSSSYPFKVCHFKPIRYAFRIPSIVNWHLFTYLVQDFVSLKTAVNALPLKCEKTTKPGSFFGLFYSHKMYLLALLGLFTDQNDKISHPFINVTQ